MSALDIAIPLIKGFEGCVLHAYQDGGGIWTIGWGRTSGVYEGQVITQEQADKWLDETVKEFMDNVVAVVLRDINDNELAAFTSFSYNVGFGAFRSSTLLRLFNYGEDKQVVAQQFPRWVHDAMGNIEPGLLRRRHEEMELFLQPV